MGEELGLEKRDDLRRFLTQGPKGAVEIEKTSIQATATSGHKWHHWKEQGKWRLTAKEMGRHGHYFGRDSGRKKGGDLRRFVHREECVVQKHDFGKVLKSGHK